MGKILQDVWIFTDTGISVFKKVHDPKQVDEQRFAMFISAINSFANKIYKGGISSFDVSNKKFSIMRKNNFLFIGNSEPDIKNKKVINELEIISKKFFEIYPIEILKYWNGDLELFANFKDHIEDSFDKKLNDFMKMI